MRGLAIALFALQLHGVATQLPTLLQPTLLGSDTSNYYAAGLRLNAGHPLYGPLQAGDRPVPGYPQIYPAPLLSPPLIAVIWRPLALLPGDVVMTGWWLGGVLVITGLVVGFALRGQRSTLLILNSVLLLQVPLSLYLQPAPNLPATADGWWSPVAIAALSGNLNSYLAGLLVLMWWGENRLHSAASGVAAAVATALKVGPVALLGWLAVRGTWRSVLLGGLALLGLAIIGALGAGLAANVEFVRLALGGRIAPSTLSLPDLLHHILGVRQAVAERAVVLVIPCGVVAMLLLRARPRAAFTVAILIAIYSSPVVLPGNLALLLAAASPAWRPRQRDDWATTGIDTLETGQPSEPPRPAAP